MEPVKRALFEKHGAVVNFSESTENYYAAYQYVCKTDENVTHSSNHPDLKDIGFLKTKKCMKAYQEKCKRKRKQNDQEKQNKKAPKMKRLTNLDVSEFLIKHNIKSDTALFAKAHEQKEAGKKDLAHFVMSRSSKALQNVIQNTWKMHTLSEKLN